MKQKFLVPVLLVMIVLFLPGCIPGSGSYDHQSPAGFFSGIWHGWIAPFSLIIGLFSRDIRVYETFNTGWWYDFGFYIAIIGGFGGINLTRNKLKNKTKHQG